MASSSYLYKMLCVIHEKMMEGRKRRIIQHFSTGSRSAEKSAWVISTAEGSFIVGRKKFLTAASSNKFSEWSSSFEEEGRKEIIQNCAAINCLLLREIERERERYKTLRLVPVLIDWEEKKDHKIGKLLWAKKVFLNDVRTRTYVQWREERGVKSSVEIEMTNQINRSEEASCWSSADEWK